MKTWIIIFTAFAAIFTASAQYSVSGGSGIPLMADNRNGVEVWLLFGMAGASISFTSDNEGQHEWFRYRTNAAEAVPVASQQSGNTSTVVDVEEGWAYFVGSPETLYRYIYLIDYSLRLPKFYSISAQQSDNSCQYLNLEADVEAEPIYWVAPSGARNQLSRTFTLRYDNLRWDEDAKQFAPISETVEINDFVAEIPLDNRPLCDTRFTLSGDAFAAYFGLADSVSADYAAIAVEAHATATTDKVGAENESHDQGDNLGGSAPVEYVFTAIANEPIAAFYVWKVVETTAEGLQNTLVRYTDKTLRYNFDRSGTFRVSLEVMDSRSACVDTSVVFNVITGETFVRIPNAFSPGSSPGVNDEFRISYRSVVAFRASIFNRWGNLLYRWTDPARGWDGRVNGKFVPTGVYYVVVEYTDAQGKKHTASCDVNILREKSE
jgi:gliding motility-associated-like protein